MTVALVTGVNGFVGRYMASLLQSEQVDVVGVGRSSLPAGHLGAIRYEACDLTCYEQVDRLLDRHSADIIIHLAGEKHVRTTHDSPLHALRTNLFTTVNLLEKVRTMKPSRLKGCLVIGSAHEYEIDGTSSVLTERTALHPGNPYGWSKLLGTTAARMYAESFALPVVIARTFNLIGPGTMGGVCAELAKQVVEMERGKRPPRLVMGDETLQRDFLDVRDAVAAYWSILRHTRLTPGDVFNVCSGTPQSLRSLVQTLQRHSRVPFQTVSDPSLFRKSDPPVLSGNCDKLQRVTGWRPTYPFEQSIIDILAYFRQQP